jgi:hypothetical protein
MTQLQKKLNNHGGRFVTLNVSRARGGVTSYSAKIQSVTNSTVRFWDANSKRVMSAPLRNVSVA